jgi:hypothetical protein
MSERAQDADPMRSESRRPSGAGGAGLEPAQLAERLRSPEVREEEAEALAREAADLVGKASAEIESDLRSTRTDETS